MKKLNDFKTRIPLQLFLLVSLGMSILLMQYCMYNMWMIPKIKKYSTCIESKKTYDEENFPTKTDTDLPTLYIITATRRRPEQLAELTRLSHALMSIPKLIWLVIEEGDQKNRLVKNVLKKSRLEFRYILVPVIQRNKNSLKYSGVSSRNKGLKWLRENAETGAFYFVDEGKTYDLEIFHQIRFTRTVSMFPVGLVSPWGMSSPLAKNCTLVSFFNGWIANKKWPVDMSGFAVSVKYLLQRPKAAIPYKLGHEVDGFLRSLEPLEHRNIELLADCCTKILVWHTNTNSFYLVKHFEALNVPKNSNLVKLINNII